MSRTKSYIAALTLALAVAPAAFAQQGDMRGMNMQGPDMDGMNMHAMMSRCVQMRQQRQRGGRLTPDAQRMLAQCDQMDSHMGNMRGSGPDQRTR